MLPEPADKLVVSELTRTSSTLKSIVRRGVSGGVPPYAPVGSALRKRRLADPLLLWYGTEVVDEDLELGALSPLAKMILLVATEMSISPSSHVL